MRKYGRKEVGILKSFEDFKKSLDLGDIIFNARKNAIEQSDAQQHNDFEEMQYITEATSALTTMKILELYHEWLNT